jgi:hypothetical protein
MPTKKISLYLTAGQAGIMAFWGGGMIFGAGLLTFIQFDPQVPTFWKVVIGIVSVYLAWLGASYIAASQRWKKAPVYRVSRFGILDLSEGGIQRIGWSKVSGLSLNEQKNADQIVLRTPAERLIIADSLDGFDDLWQWIHEQAEAQSNSTGTTSPQFASPRFDFPDLSDYE